MKYAALALTLLVSGSLIAMETEEKGKVKRVYDAIRTDLGAVPGKTKEVVFGLPKMAKDGAFVLYDGTKIRIKDPQKTAEEVAAKSFKVAKLALAVGVPAYIVAKVLDYASK